MNFSFANFYPLPKQNFYALLGSKVDVYKFLFTNLIKVDLFKKSQIDEKKLKFFNRNRIFRKKCGIIL